MTPINHGKRQGYQQGCRLPCCTEAQRAYAQAYWKKNGDKRKRATLARATAGVMHEFERPAAKSTYIPSNSRGQHQFERIEPEAVPAPDISFAGWAKRRATAGYPMVDLRAYPE
jgi:hypothetical protein